MYPREKIELTALQARLSGNANDPTKGAVVALTNPSNNLPTCLEYKYCDIPLAAEALSATISTVDEANRNLNDHEKELLHWHQRLGHLGFRKIQTLMHSGVLAQSEKTRRLHARCCKIDFPPKCGGCLYGKQTRKPSPGKTSSVVHDTVGNIKKDQLMVGQRVSVDHFVCSTKGRLLGSQGKTTSDKMYTGG
jgi:hypothetical protein